MKTFICTKSFRATGLPGYEGEALEFKRGVTQIAANHPAVKAHPENFKELARGRAVGAARSTPHPPRARKRSLAEELRIRADRVSELQRDEVLGRRERERNRGAEREFWRETAELLERGSVERRTAEVLAEYDPELEEIEEAADEARRRAAFAGESEEEFYERAAELCREAELAEVRELAEKAEEE